MAHDALAMGLHGIAALAGVGLRSYELEISTWF